MEEKLLELINNEDKKQPYTDAELAEILTLRRETVIGLRKKLGFPDSRERRKEILFKAMKEIISNDEKISERELTRKVKELGFKVSRHVIREYKKAMNAPIGEKDYKDGDKRKISENKRDFIDNRHSYSNKKYSSFSNIIGEQGSLKPYIQQAKAAMLYPPHGLHTLILGPTGVGKSELAESMYKFAKEANILDKKSNMVTFNCADYADNPQLLMSQLFGYVKGAFTGAEGDKEGLVEKANGGILFLDEVHRLPPEGQELLFYLIDKGRFRRLGETNAQREVKLTIIAATTENADSMLLATFRRRIPMVIELPDLSVRPIDERIKIINTFFSMEAQRIQTAIKVHNDVIRALLLYECPGNVGQLKSDIQVSCAKGFLNYVTNSLKMMEITIDEIPIHSKKGLLKTQNFRPEIEKLIQHDDLIIQPNSEKNHTDIDNDMYSMPYEIYEFIENRYRSLQEQFSNQEVINYIIGSEMQRKVENLLKKVETSIKPIEKRDLINIVGIEIVEVVDKILKIANRKLRIITDHLFYVLSVHLNTTLTRLRDGKTILNPQLKKIKENYPKEFETAQEMVEVVNRELKVELTEDETGFLAMYLSTATNKEESVIQGRVGVLVATHGSVSNAMVEVANRLLGVNFAKSVNMSLDESPQIALERTMEIVKSMDEGKGVLLLVDMGSLVTFGEIITKQTGIRTRSISRVDTVTVIEAVRRAMLPNSDLDEIVDSIEEKPKYISRLAYSDKKVEFENPKKRQVIVTICITGQGSAQKIKELLENVISSYKDSIKIIPIGALESNIRDVILDIQEKEGVISIVGTVNPNINDIPFICLEDIIKGDGVRQLKNLIESTEIKEQKEYRLEKELGLVDLLHPSLTILDMDSHCKEDVIFRLSKLLIDNKYVKEGFTYSVLSREEIGPTYFTGEITIPHGEPEFVIKPAIALGRLKREIDWNGRKIKFVMMLALTSECINVVEEMCDFFKVKDNLKLIIENDSFDGIKDVFKAYQGGS